MNFADLLNTPELNTMFYGNTVRDYLLSLVVFLAAVLFTYALKGTIILRLKKLAEQTNTDLDDVFISAIDELRWPFYISLPIYFASQMLTLNDNIQKGVSTTALLLVLYYAVKFVQDLAIYALKRTLNKRTAHDDTDEAIQGVAIFVLKTALWSLAVLLLLQNAGINVTAVLGGLGIGGLAVAFAFQSILSDLFSFFTIYFDKPFAIGDFIVIGDDMGTVERIGLKSTRVRTLQGEELVLSNSDIMASRINNYKKMEKRRVLVELGVIYNTPSQKLRKIPEIVEKFVDSEPLAEFERAHFRSFGDSALVFEVVYYILSNEYIEYMNTQQSINYGILEAFENEGIAFAYPTQQIFLSKQD